MIARPWVYDLMRLFFGLRTHLRHIRPHLARAHGNTVLDLGAGTGVLASLLPPTAYYIWFDNDTEKLEGFASPKIPHSAIIGDATQSSFRDRSVDLAICVNVSHHLSDAQLSRVLGELARIVKGKLILVDGLKAPGFLLSNILWRYDRGEYPRGKDTLASAVEQWFKVEWKELYCTYRPYLLCVATPL